MSKGDNTFTFHKNPGAGKNCGPNNLEVRYNEISGCFRLFFRGSEQANGYVGKGLDKVEILGIIEHLLADCYNPVAGDLSRQSRMPS